jgi:hypothetical protein
VSGKSASHIRLNAIPSEAILTGLHLDGAADVIAVRWIDCSAVDNA